MSEDDSEFHAAEGLKGALSDSSTDNDLLRFDVRATRQRSTMSKILEYRWTCNLASVVIYVLLGVAIAMYYGFSFVTSLYLILQVVTTIGYGDITVRTPGWECLMMVYCFFGIAVVANILNDFVKLMIDYDKGIVQRRLKRLERALAPECMEKARDVREHGVLEAFNRLLVAMLVWMILLVSWALFFSWFESCCCSYGYTEVEGCIEGDACEASGGYTINFREALYMGFITFATVGFGDFSPRSRTGRIFAIIWMVLGVMSWASFVTNLSMWFHQFKDRHKALLCTPEMFALMDKDSDDTISREEFQVFYLLRENRIEASELTDIDALFNAIDKNGNGKLTYEELIESLDVRGQLIS